MSRWAHRIPSAMNTCRKFIDLVAFKAVNDTYGHDAGDQLLREVAGRLRLALRADDLLARQGGDKFSLLLHDTASRARRRDRRTRRPGPGLRPDATVHSPGPPLLSIGASIGIALAPHDTDDPETLLRHADTAMYTAKRTAGTCWTSYS